MKALHFLFSAAALLATAGVAFGEGGTVSGTVTFAGTPPAQKPFPVPSAFKVCGSDGSMDRLIIGKNNGVANSVIYIVGLKKTPSSSATAASFVADQMGCRYHPHVLVVREGDEFTALNSDSMFHNVHGYLDANHTTVFNLAQPNKGMKIVQRVKQPGMYQLRCDVHPWMNAYVYVAGNGYATVTGEDGKFTLSDVPPGIYKLVMWHEGWNTKLSSGRPEFSDAVQQTQDITVTAAQATTVNFTLR
jgi:plastocyanin